MANSHKACKACGNFVRIEEAKIVFGRVYCNDICENEHVQNTSKSSSKANKKAIAKQGQFKVKKAKKPKQTKIRASANGECCSLRLGQCSSHETVVLAHIGKVRGMGIKCADYMAVYACMNCHDIIDGRVETMYTKDRLGVEKIRALEETLLKLFNKGLLKIT